MEVTKSFMIDKTTGVCSGTLFIIKDTVCGCDAQPFSFMPEKGKTSTQLKTTTMKLHHITTTLSCFHFFTFVLPHSCSQCFVFVIGLNRDTS